MMSSLRSGVFIRLPSKYNSCSVFRGLLLDGSATEFRLRRHHTRSVHLAPWRHSKADPLAETDKVRAKPLRFSSSKGSHHAWTVDRSMGSTFQRPWWKVFPVSLTGVAFLIWAMFQNGSDLDPPVKKSVVRTPT